MTGTVRTEVDGRICRIVVDNVAKKNAFTPDMMAELSNAFTAFDADDARRTLKPVVAAVQGLCLTVGIEMMLAADIVIAADTARFCQMESKRGIAPLGGAHFRFLTRTGWGNAMYHLMLCDEFDAERALQIGLVQEVVPAGQQVARASEIAHRIAGNAPIGIRAMKEAALKFIQAGEAMAIAGIPAIHAAVMGTEDAKEGIRSFVERREAQFQGR